MATRGASAATVAYTPSQRASDATAMVATYERAVLAGRDAYVALFDFEWVGAYERLLQRYDLYRGDWLGESEDARRDAPPEPLSAERERTNVTRLFDAMGAPIVGTGHCRATAARGEYVRRLATFEPLPADDRARWQPLRSRILGVLACGGLVVMRCDGGRDRIGIVFARLPCRNGATPPAAPVRVITVYVDTDAPP